MVQASPHVTAAQVLEAGRRAEADGRVEYAVQFYRHLADHHAGAPEAAVAREALSRLKHQASNLEGMPHVRTASPPPLRATHHGPAESSRMGQKVGRGPIRIAPAGAARSSAALELPEAAEAYLAGRLIAHGFAVLGILFFAVGSLAAAAALLLPAEFVARVPVSLMPAVHPIAGLAGIVLGIMLLFSGQLARAVFDIASASRDIAAIERAKVEHANAVLR